jgi:hypothetical protein
MSRSPAKGIEMQTLIIPGMTFQQATSKIQEHLPDGVESVFEERQVAPFLNETFNNIVVDGVSGFEAPRVV